MPLLEVRQLGYRYAQRSALEGVAFSLEPGERLGLVGPNGAGKSTLLRLLCGVHRPSAGELSLGGAPATPAELRARVGIVFQRSEDMLFTSRVWEDVCFGPRQLGLPEEEVRQRAEAALAAVEASHLRERVPLNLSGGEKRRVALAAVLAMRPEVLVLDEPTSDLDPRGRRGLLTLLEARAEALIVATHDLEFVLRLCQRVLVLDEGRVVASGPAAEVLGNEELMLAHGLERPHSLEPEPHTHGAGARALTHSHRLPAIGEAESTGAEHER